MEKTSLDCKPARFIGEEAVRLMSLRLGSDTLSPRQVLFSSELVPRRSTICEKHARGTVAAVFVTGAELWI